MYEIGETETALREKFAVAVRRYLPKLDPAKLEFEFAGVRPKLSGPGEPAADFLIDVHEGNGRLVSLLGMESPGLTASLAVGDWVSKLVRGK